MKNTDINWFMENNPVFWTVIFWYVSVYIYIYTSSTVVPQKAATEVSTLGDELLWCMDGRAHPLLDWKVVGVSGYLSIYPSIHPSIHPPIYLTAVHLSICVSVHLSMFLTHYLSMSLSIDWSVCQSIYRCVCLSVCLPAWLSVWLSGWLAVCLSVLLSNNLSIYLSLIYLSVFHLSICLIFCPSICVSIYLCTCKLENEAILRDFLRVWSWQHQRRSNSAPKGTHSARRPPFDNTKNEANLRDFLQKWKAECRADGLVPMRLAIFCIPSV